MDFHPPNDPPTISSPPPRLFQPLPRLLPHPPAPSTSLNPSPPTTRPPPSSLTIHTLTPSTLPSFKRLTTLLFPIRYPDRFFTDILSDPTTSSLSRIAFWRESPHPAKRTRPTDPADETDAVPTAEPPTVVGGIRCRLEATPGPSEPDGALPAPTPPPQLYVQTLGVLAPYRGLGIASALLDEVVEVGVREYGIGGVYAHVWEANAEALEWYLRRGFVLEQELVEGYYRRLRPAGARVVRRRVGVGEYVRVGRMGGLGTGEDGGGDENTLGQTEGLREEPGGMWDDVDRASLDHVAHDTATTPA